MYRLLLQNDRMYVEIGGDLWLIDTGSPSTFGDKPSVTINGDLYNVPRSAGGLDNAAIEAIVGMEGTGLMGTDILDNYTVTFDVDGGSIQFSHATAPTQGVVARLRMMGGLPTTTIEVDGKAFTMALDTGARFGVLQSPLTDRYPFVCHHDDYNPIVGAFRLAMHSVPATFAGVKCTLTLGRCTTNTIDRLSELALDGVLGLELFRNRTVTYCPKEGVAVFDPAPA